ncbi:MAG TPA: GLUG motif-containing protein [archaeon]|nr:GLUG motif-containing protein [archaeon]
MKISIYKKRALAPIISAILLLVVGVILVTIVLTWGKNFTTKNLDSATDFGALSASDASLFVFSKTFKEGVVMFTYSPPSYLMDEEITITHYRIVDIPEMTSVQLTTPVTLSASTNIVPLECLYEYSKSSADITIQFITTENKYIEVKTRDPNIVCTSGGTGTEEDPIIVCNAEDLNDIRTDLDANYALGKDIDLQCFSRQDINGWEPIGTDASPFTGSLDGQNHKISNLYINRPTADYVGLFKSATVESTIIKNLGLEDVNITGNGQTGGIFGSLEYGQITNSYVSGYISGGASVGGLIGSGFNPNISNSHSTGEIRSNESAGGIAGTTEGGAYNNCYSLANVTRNSGVSETSFGGFIGLIEGTPTVNNSYSTGQIIYEGTTNPTNRGFSSDAITGTSCYWDTETSGQLTSGSGATGKTTAEMKTQSTFTGWDFSSIWGMDSSTNSGYPYLRSNPPD